MNQGSCGFAGRSVLLIGAGCALGRVLARLYANAGARVVVIDNDEDQLLTIAKQNRDQISTLRLNCLDATQLTNFINIWSDEPLDALVHLQPLRHLGAQGRGIASIVRLTEGLAPALARGQGRVLILYRGTTSTTSLQKRALSPAWDRLSNLLSGQFSGDGLRVNALRLNAGAGESVSGRQVVESALMLTQPRPSEITGAVLHLGADTD